MERPQWLPHRGIGAGVLLAAAVGAVALLAARLLPQSPFLSDILLAIVLGTLMLNTGLAGLVGLARPGVEREADRYAHGLRYVGKWFLRASIILMGLKVRAAAFGSGTVALIAGVLAVGLPSAFLIAHSFGAWLGLRRPLSDLLAAGTMICGASAVNAVAPIAGAHRSEQGVATAAVFVFSVFALLVFRPIAHAIGLDPAHAGLWSGLAVNDLASAIAVGEQMGGDGGVLAAGAKSVRVLMLAPLLLIFAFARTGRGRPGTPGGILAVVPRYLFGYVALALVRLVGDRFLAGNAAWDALLAADRWAVDLLLLCVAAGIGLHLDVGTLLRSGPRALLAAGAASLWTAAVSLAVIVAVARGAGATGALIAVVALVASIVLWRLAGGPAAAIKLLEGRFAAGMPLSLAEATTLLDHRERLEEPLDEETRRRLLRQLHPSIGELIPARESPLEHGDGSRWLTYWLGRSGWALVAVVREPSSTTPIHAHSHRLLAKTIEGSVEELRFLESDGAVALKERFRPAHDELVETEGLATVHAIRTLGPRPAIDLQLRGPEAGSPGRRLRAARPLDLETLAVGDRVEVVAEVDDRPGHGGEGPAVGRPPPATS